MKLHINDNLKTKTLLTINWGASSLLWVLEPAAILYHHTVPGLCSCVIATTQIKSSVLLTIKCDLCPSK